MTTRDDDGWSVSKPPKDEAPKTFGEMIVAGLGTHYMQLDDEGLRDALDELDALPVSGDGALRRIYVARARTLKERIRVEQQRRAT